MYYGLSLQINDDSEMISTDWEKNLIGALTNSKIFPNFGVGGWLQKGRKV